VGTRDAGASGRLPGSGVEGGACVGALAAAERRSYLPQMARQIEKIWGSPETAKT